jgi:hypothetical protein
VKTWVFRFTLKKNHLLEDRTEEREFEFWSQAYDHGITLWRQHKQQGFEIVRFSFGPKGTEEQNVFGGSLHEPTD